VKSIPTLTVQASSGTSERLDGVMPHPLGQDHIRAGAWSRAVITGVLAIVLSHRSGTLAFRHITKGILLLVRIPHDQLRILKTCKTTITVMLSQSLD
jgi:hypothetical protein